MNTDTVFSATQTLDSMAHHILLWLDCRGIGHGHDAGFQSGVRCDRGQLHAICSCFRQGTTFPPAEGDVGNERLSFEAVPRVDESITLAVDIGVVDLGGVSYED